MLLKKSFIPYTFVVPGFIIALGTVLLPNLFTLVLAFTNYSLYHFEDYKFIGFNNFSKILLGAEMKPLISVLGWTLIWAALSVFLSLALGLVLAIVLHDNFSNLFCKKWIQIFLILPWALPNFITILVWHGLLNTNFGLVNHILSITGIPPVSWLEDPLLAKVSVLMVNLWLGFPFMMSVCLGGLESIPKEIYEAAMVDGASPWSRFHFLTLPLLASILLPVIITSFAFQFNQFNVIYLLTEGGPPILGSPAGSTDILVTYAYKLAFNQFRFGLSCAYGVLIFMIVAALSIGNFALTGGLKRER